MTHVTCRLTAKNRDRLRNPTLGNRVWATFTLFTLRSVGCEVVLCARACVRVVCMCVCRATVIERGNMWFRDDGALTRVFCEDSK